MAKSHILSKAERQAFNLPPVFTAEGRAHYFNMTEETKLIVNKMYSETSKIAFVLLLGYFKCAGRFFIPNTFHKKDGLFVAKLLNIDQNKFDMMRYNDRTFLSHKKIILETHGIRLFDAEAEKLFFAEIDRLVDKQTRPKIIIIKLCELAKQKKIEVPSYRRLEEIILSAQKRFESGLIKILERSLHRDHKRVLDTLLSKHNEQNKPHQRSTITKMKTILLSTRPAKIKENVKLFLMITELFEQFKSVIDALHLSRESLKYYATWTHKARVLNLAAWEKPSKRYLCLLAFIAHQYRQRQDLLIDTVLKSVRSTVNTVNRRQQTLAFDTKKEKDRASIKLSTSYNEKRYILSQIREIILSSPLTDTQKIELIRNLVIETPASMTAEQEEEFIALLDKKLMKSLMNMDYYDLLESSSVKLQNRVSLILKHIQFNPVTSEVNIIEAIDYFKQYDGHISQDPPLNFLTKEQANILVNENGKFRVSLYKAMLFIKIADAIKAGTLNLVCSYHYLSLDEYLLPKKQWDLNRAEWIRQAGFEHLANFIEVVSPLKASLHERYCKINERINAGENVNITFNSTLAI